MPRKYGAMGEIVEKKMELTAACYRLATLIKAGKTPVDYERKWKEFKKKTSKK